MKCFCPACGGPNEVHSENEKVRCAWCSTVFSAAALVSNPVILQESRQPDSEIHSSLTHGAAAAGTASAAADAAKVSVDAAASVLAAAQKSGAAADPEWTAKIIAEAAKAAATAAAAAKAAEAAAAAARSAVPPAMQTTTPTAAQAAAPVAAQSAMPVDPGIRVSGAVQPVMSGRQGGTASGAVQSGVSGARQATEPVSAQSTAPVAAHPAANETARTAQAGAEHTAADSAAHTSSGPRYAVRKFADSRTGIVLAKAIVPEAFTSGGTLLQTWQSDQVPFTASFQAASPDRRILFSSTSGELFVWYLNPMIRSLAKKTPNVILSSFREFMEPNAYLQQYAQKMAGVPLTPTARAKLPSTYGRDLAGERQRLLQYIESHMINITVRETVSTCYCDAFLYRYEGMMSGRKIIVLAGCDYKGIESYDANGGPAAMNLFSMGMQGGLLGQLMRGKKENAAGETGSNRRRNSARVSPTGVGAGDIPFGHGKEYGKNVDAITWGSERLYFMAAPIEMEKSAAEAFLRFVGSITPDPALWKQRSLLIEQKHQSRILEAQQLNRQAVQMQMEAQQRQRDLARQIQANSEEISRGIMDSWEKRSASQSRMSENWSQAIRGVDTYRTPSGRVVEADVSADHVYQNRYGDTIEVSGTALDDELVTRLDWTKLERQD